MCLTNKKVELSWNLLFKWTFILQATFCIPKLNHFWNDFYCELYCHFALNLKMGSSHSTKCVIRTQSILEHSLFHKNKENGKNFLLLTWHGKLFEACFPEILPYTEISKQKPQFKVTVLTWMHLIFLIYPKFMHFMSKLDPLKKKTNKFSVLIFQKRL